MDVDNYIEKESYSAKKNETSMSIFLKKRLPSNWDTMPRGRLYLFGWKQGFHEGALSGRIEGITWLKELVYQRLRSYGIAEGDARTLTSDEDDRFLETQSPQRGMVEDD